MTITFPLSVESFIELIKPLVIVPSLLDQQEYATQASGGVIAKDIGSRIWTADVETVPICEDDAPDVQATIESLLGSIGTFYVFNSIRRYPKADPTGSIVGASAVKINAGTAYSALSFKGLPAGYVLTRGDQFSVDYSSGALRYYGRILETAAADGSGVTGEIAVAPFWPDPITVNDVVNLKKPTFRACILPGSLQIIPERPFVTFKFKCLQRIKD